MHAFLFADLRGYTEFAATRGDRAAADLLGRYRSLVRDQVARHAGAEVRTEGDSFYILFVSVSEAVQCALAIAAAAREASLDDPALPMNVGIGVHFGETVDTAEGSVGSAVNLAARLASAAGPNEVLVSDVVRSLLRGATDVRTASAGSRRLKGFGQPIPVFRAIGGDAIGLSGTGRRRVSPRAGLVAGGAAVALVVIGILWASGLVGGVPAPSTSLGPAGSGTPTPGNSASETAASTPLAFKVGPLEPGQYVDQRFVPSVSIEVDEGWCGGFFAFMLATVPGPDTFYMYWPGTPTGGAAAVFGNPCVGGERDEDAGSVALYNVELVYGPTACEDGVTRSVEGSWNALVEYLTAIPGTSATGRVSASLGGAVGVAFDLHVDVAAPCAQSGAPVRAVLAFPTTVIERATGRARVQARWFGEGQYLRVWVVDVEGQLVVAVLTRDGSTTPPSTAFTRKAYPVIDTLRFLPSS